MHKREATYGTGIYKRISSIFHIGQSYGVSESNCFKIIKWVEDTLIKHPDFALPEKKVVLNGNVEREILVIDGTQIHIERPKKSRNDFIQERKRSV